MSARNLSFGIEDLIEAQESPSFHVLARLAVDLERVFDSDLAGRVRQDEYSSRSLEDILSFDGVVISCQAEDLGLPDLGMYHLLLLSTALTSD